MRVRDLLAATPELGLALLTPDVPLDGELRWVYTTDLLEPAAFLTGGELVLTSEGWYRTPADCETFAASLAEGGVAALVAGDILLGEVPPLLVEACARRGIPVLAAPPEISYGTLARTVIDRINRERGRELAEVLGRHRRLVAALVEGADLGGLVAMLAAELGTDCWALSVTGRLLAGPADRLPTPVRTRLAAHALRAPRLPTALDGHTLLPIGRRGAGGGHLVVRDPTPAKSPEDTPATVGPLEATGTTATPEDRCPPTGTTTTREAHTPATTTREAHTPITTPPGTHPRSPAPTAPRTSLTPNDLDTAEQTAELLALGGARRDERRRTEQRFHSDLVALVDSGAPQPTLDARLRTAGLAPHRPLVALTALTRGALRPWDLAADLAEGALDETPAAATVVAGSENGLTLLASLDPEDTAAALTERLRVRLSAFEPAADGGRIAFGLSAPAPSSGLQRALEESRHAAGLAALRPQRLALVTAAELDSHLMLLAGVPPRSAPRTGIGSSAPWRRTTRSTARSSYAP
ncbi:hypothetical protein SSPIM334S_05451 [Streptomyces spiroverticillatus]